MALEIYSADKQYASGRLVGDLSGDMAYRGTSALVDEWVIR